MKCPDCENGVEIASHVHYADGSGAFNVPMKCLRCQGACIVPDETPEWIKQGRAMREERVGRQITLREEAKRRGMDMVTLSRMEQGVIEPKWN